MRTVSFIVLLSLQVCAKAPVVAQQFTVDPRLLTAISSGGKANEIASDTESEIDSDDDDNDSVTASVHIDIPPPQTQTQAGAAAAAAERRLRLERLSAEYEAELAKGCLSCGS